jgi:RimJ/RimL family protein N-acetyltransferase
MQNTYDTARLTLTPLTLNHDAFIITLLNSPGWLRFIGDRKVKTADDAKAYITKIVNSTQFKYWVAKLKDTGEPIGVITLIERDYLPHPDIGFAFLPAYAKMGYAFEGADAVMHGLALAMGLSRLLAITLRDNVGSIGLLKKLGFVFDREMERDGEVLEVWGRDLGGDRVSGRTDS